MILNELTCELVSIQGCNFTAITSSLIFEPLAFKQVSILVVHLASQLAIIILYVTFIVLTIGEQDLHMAVLKFPAIKAGFHNLIWWTEENSLSLGAIFAPLSLIYDPVDELTNASAVPLVILPLSLEDVPARQNHLTLAVLCTL